MDFEESLHALANKIEQQRSFIETEEATKTAFILPFIQSVLGYDVFNPTEVIPEFTADVGIKKGEKVDYAIAKDGNIQILIECKKIGDELNIKHASQLYRYFGVTTAKIAVLTNGQIYKFYTDLDSQNRMDEKPFLVLDICEIDEHVIPELEKLTKPAFDVDSIVSSAGELKYVGQIRRIIAQQLKEPDDEFVRFFVARVYDGPITQRIREQFAPLTLKAIKQYLNDQINDRLKNALSPRNQQPAHDTQPDNTADHASTNDSDDGVVTTLEEIEGFNIVKAIIRSSVEVSRIAARDTKSYFGILLDDNNRKPICRLHFNRAQKYIGIFDVDKKEIRHPIQDLDEIFNFSDELKSTAESYNE